ncbi:MAG TPA: ribosome recycling factor [Firmicutes bacterium]|uniref:Ribosome-recycling factor n=1 Tax=Candidatus Fermentithermobacillus carboniphilus TaxID=3085328 RepID=A0AAT9LC23_9FIRM|nr:MAG: ribosome recycling factor [Candidatus Fermentithermobacillus carboniphilus]HHW18187.1 ribosome recycling factor [Candidatus Fermentithermobacillaceae bacterium]
MDERSVLSQAEDKMKKVIEAFKKNLASVRAGRASPVLLEKVFVDYYGVPTPINQVATIGVAPPRTLVIQPWDKKMLSTLEKAIQKADLGAMPINDGNVIRLTIPPLSGDRRQEIIKSIRKDAESQKVSIRNIRRDINEEIKKAEKDKTLSEDDSRRIQDKVQKLTDKYVKMIDDLVAAKEKEVMEV